MLHKIIQATISITGLWLSTLVCLPEIELINRNRIKKVEMEGNVDIYCHKKDKKENPNINS